MIYIPISPGNILIPISRPLPPSCIYPLPADKAGIIEKNETNERTHYAESSSNISFRSSILAIPIQQLQPERERKEKKTAEQRVHHPSQIVSTQPLQILKCLHHAISGSINKRRPISLRVQWSMLYRYSSSLFDVGNTLVYDSSLLK